MLPRTPGCAASPGGVLGGRNNLSLKGRVTHASKRIGRQNRDRHRRRSGYRPRVRAPVPRRGMQRRAGRRQRGQGPRRAGRSDRRRRQRDLLHHRRLQRSVVQADGRRGAQSVRPRRRADQQRGHLFDHHDEAVLGNERRRMGRPDGGQPQGRVARGQGVQRANARAEERGDRQHIVGGLPAGASGLRALHGVQGRSARLDARDGARARRVQRARQRDHAGAGLHGDRARDRHAGTERDDAQDAVPQTSRNAGGPGRRGRVPRLGRRRLHHRPDDQL